MARILTRGKSADGGDARLRTLLAWVPVKVTFWKAVAGDASRRRYFRLHTPEGSLIAMDAPPPEDTRRFLRMARLLRVAGIRVPEIFASDPERGFVLLEDFGDCTYLKALDDGNVDRLYDEALDTLGRLQTRFDPRIGALPPYSRALLVRELEIFRDWLLGRWLGLEVPQDLWRGVVAVLVDSALEQPRVAVHRDYHSRNLMHLRENGPGVLDFQDAVIGPVTYDVVSLLRDCYIAWPRERVRLWSEAYRLRLAATGTIIGPSQWRCWFDRMGVQRHLKAAGIFVRLWLRDGKPAYLADIPRTLGYVTAVCREDRELKALGVFLEREVLPRLEVKR